MSSITAVQPQLLWNLAPTFPQHSPFLKPPRRESQQLDLENIVPYEPWAKFGNVAPFAMCHTNQSSLPRLQPHVSAMSLTETALPIQPAIQPINLQNRELEGSTQGMGYPAEGYTKDIPHVFVNPNRANKDWKTRRDKVLQRNREAAKRCRQRKKLVVEEIESLADAQAWRNNELRGQIEHLRYEILDLHSEILKHAQCDDEPIKQYLAQRVRKISEDHSVGTASPPPIDPQLSSSFEARFENGSPPTTDLRPASGGSQYDPQRMGTDAIPFHNTTLAPASSGERTTERTLFELISY
ncbi:bZIP transcription factor [Aspergillus alliaceus]|uniref:bZIP transcription factor n=1 Tax=Petromyces alliaceus TaxID=209559 RepID=UPI0012A60591|nr:uncharacterized protein BDW43DRAFT_316482 [Aspergillus alliaceus]KAB8227794.1 hypothetical protein BDW43DRAFT_316482 [Aspergillus alliaceus]